MDCGPLRGWYVLSSWTHSSQILTVNKDTSNELQSYLAEAYSHETRHSTGELYVKMRQAQLGNDELSEKRWRARLTACELSRLQMLQKNPDLYSAFDAFMDMPGILESGAILTVWNKFISLRCNDVLPTLPRIISTPPANVHRSWCITSNKPSISFGHR